MPPMRPNACRIIFISITGENVPAKQNLGVNIQAKPNTSGRDVSGRQAEETR